MAKKELLGGTARTTAITAGLSGGNEYIKYSFRGTYQQETTVLPARLSDQKGSVHFTVNSTSLNRKFNIQFSTLYLVDNNKLPFGDFTKSVVLLAPNAPTLYNSDGSLNWMPNSLGMSSFDNPLKSVYKSSQLKTINVVGNIDLQYQLFPNLSLKSNIGYNRIASNELTMSPSSASRPEERTSSYSRVASYGNEV